MRYLSSLTGLLLCFTIASTFAAAPTAPGVPSNERRSTAAAGPKRERPLPFYGNIGSIDKKAQTIKVYKKIYQVTPETKVTKHGRPATLAEAAPGDEVSGSYRKVDGNPTLQLVSLRIGPKPEVK